MTLPALPLHTEPPCLPNHQSLKLALCWLRGGYITDYLALDVSDNVLISMLLAAAHDFSDTNREIALNQAYWDGLREGLTP
jgi:hypothetical protein